MTKEKITIRCECGKRVSGFSQKHLEWNKTIHDKFSIRHQETMKMLKEKGLSKQ